MAKECDITGKRRRVGGGYTSIVSERAQSGFLLWYDGSMSLIDGIFVVAVIMMSAVIHEVMHGVAAERLGDPTARLQGRITLNPISHLDPMGSIILPLVLVLTNAPILFGWAKPVPYNPHNLRPGRFSEAIVAVAGPVSNIFLALIFGFLLRLGIAGGYASESFIHITSLVVFINILLAVFNLVPIPPLDGSKLLFALFPENTFKLRNFFERYGLMLVILFIFFAWQFIAPIVFYLFRVVTGINF